MEPSPPSDSSTIPPRAFTQGLGTVFQFTGVILFLLMMSICCGSSLLSKESSERPDLTKIGWHFGRSEPVYSAQVATALTVPMGVMFGIALATLGLGLQATHRKSPLIALLVTISGTAFWLIQTAFAVHILHSILLALVGLILIVLFGLLTVGSWHAWREMTANPPPPDHEILPADYKTPYSHMHQDPPEVRLAAELEQRRERLAVQQKELELLEDKLKKKLRIKDQQGES